MKARIGKQHKIRTGIFLALILSLVACGTGESYISSTPTSEPEPLAPTPTQVVSITPTEVAPTATPTSKPVEIPIPKRPEFTSTSKGLYTESQWKQILGGKFFNQESTLKNWTENYWGRALNRPFLPGSNDLTYKYMFDLEDIDQAIVVIEAKGYPFNGQIFYLPIKDSQFMTIPPEAPVGGYSFPPGLGPKALSGGNYGLALANVDGQLVRVDAKGKVVETINMKTGGWEKAGPEIVTFALTDGGIMEMPKFDNVQEAIDWLESEIVWHYGNRADYNAEVLRVHRSTMEVQIEFWEDTIKLPGFTYALPGPHPKYFPWEWTNKDPPSDAKFWFFTSYYFEIEGGTVFIIKNNEGIFKPMFIPVPLSEFGEQALKVEYHPPKNIP